LGAREWDGVFRTDSAAVLDGLSVDDAVTRIVELLPENPIDSDDDNDNDCGESARAQSQKGTDTSAATALVSVNNERQLTTFQSAAVEHFTSREFQGLSPNVPEGHDTTILPGQFGIAAGYVRYEKKADV
jgi:hypothetical protein